MEKLTPEYAADALAEALEVSESGFAAHCRKAERPRRRHDALRPLIRESFEASGRTYACVRVRLDLQDHGQRCVAHRSRQDMRGELTTTTLAHAVHRQPPPPGLLHHSDRGVQYAAVDFARLTAVSGITLSMSRTANPYDNALAESFVATLKTECFGDAVTATRTTAQLMAFDYIESFYNRRRRHSSLSYCSSLDFEKISPPQKTVTTNLHQIPTVQAAFPRKDHHALFKLLHHRLAPHARRTHPPEGIALEHFIPQCGIGHTP